MSFTSGYFFFFFLGFYLLYVFSQGRLRLQNTLLLVASYFFYGFWDYRFLVLILISTVVDYISAQQIEKSKKISSPQKARYWLWFSVITNLSILGLFKYYNFFIENFTAFLTQMGLSVTPYTLEIILPVGISFYTFQTMSYTIDVYRGRQRATHSPLNFAIYVSFFPQLMAGPIERAKKLLPQIERSRTISHEDFREGGWLILWGMFKKVYIADNLAPYTYWALIAGGGSADTALDLYIACIAFVIQFYCDFSGYSDMARGMARLMGFRLSLNFNLPYLASNPSELWRRWHITLSNWFRDYVYAEIRKLNDSRLWQLCSLILTMLLVGLWHGPTWGFIIWGGLWGGTLAIHFMLKPIIAKSMKKQSGIKHWLGVLLTFNLWLLIGAFFISPNANSAISNILLPMLTGFDSSAASASDAARVLFYIFPLLIIQAIQYKQRRLDIFKSTHGSVRLIIYIFLLFLLWTNGAQNINDFIYFQF